MHFYSKFIDKKTESSALSFYGPKIILDHPNNFGWVPIILDGFYLF